MVKDSSSDGCEDAIVIKATLFLRQDLNVSRQWLDVCSYNTARVRYEEIMILWFYIIRYLNFWKTSLDI